MTMSAALHFFHFDPDFVLINFRIFIF